MAKLVVQVWSDIACPWCYIGKRRLEGALRRFEHAADVAVHWRAFELDPSAPRTPLEPGGHAARLARKYGFSVAEADKRIASITKLAAEEGLDFRYDRMRGSSTFDAHRLIHMAGEHGKQDSMKERLLRAYFTEGVAMSDREALVRLAGECGLDVDAAQAVLSGDDFAAEVRADEAMARDASIHGVPFFLLGRYAVEGAQPSEVLLRALRTAWGELPPELVAGAGAVCGPDGCPI
jgi:predicted DsbA family dithiol-disulfide isomerase